jgi:hypothetical protein
MGSCGVTLILVLGCILRGGYRGGVSATCVMGHKRPPVALLTIQLDPAPQYLIEICVGLVVGVGQGSLIVSLLLLA